MSHADFTSILIFGGLCCIAVEAIQVLAVVGLFAVAIVGLQTLLE